MRQAAGFGALRHPGRGTA